MLEHLTTVWGQPDEGLWEVRGAPRQFTYSKVMAWVAFDRGIRAMEAFGLDGPSDHWRAVRRAIHEDVCTHGFDPQIGSFVQSYGSTELDASLLLLPTVGFLPPGDPRVRGTVEAVEGRLFERLLRLRNDVGLLAEEYDTRAQRLVGNFPQAFSHIALVNTAHNLARTTKPAEQRSAS